jgi:phage shock protein PspC (stress-responsive transcriptional regulator)
MVLRPPLRRSRDDRVVAGVCGGLGRTLGVDPVLLRVLVVVFTVIGGAGLLAYLVGWLLVPEDGTDTSEGQRLVDGVRRDPSAARSVLTVVGAVVVALIAVPLLIALADGHAAAGTILIAAAVVGGAVVWASRRPAAPPAAPVAYGAPTTAAAAPAAPGTEAQAFGDTLVTPTTVLPSSEPAGYAYGGTGGYGPYGPTPTGFVPPPAAPAPPRERSALGALTVSLAVLATGVLAAVSLLGGSVPAVAYLAVPLTVLGIGLLVGAVVGRARWLLLLAIPLALMTALVAAVPQAVRDTAGAGVGQPVWRPTTVAAASTPYQLAAGDARLDLTTVPLTSGATPVPVSVRVGLGQLVVVVPAHATVQVTARVGVGDLRLPGQRVAQGTSLSQTTVLEPTGPSAGTLALDLEVGIGSMEVRRAAS